MVKTAPRLARKPPLQPASGETMTGRLFPAVLFASALTLGAVIARADAPPELIKAYAAGVAGAKCDLNLDSGASSKLGDAVQRVEQKSGLAQDELDALWSKTQADADSDKAGFCEKSGPLVQALLK